MKKLTNLMIVLFMVAMLTAPLLAYHHGMKAKKVGMKMQQCSSTCAKLEGLDLSAEQKVKIDKLRKDHFAQKDVRKKAMRKISLEMKALMNAETPDKAAIYKKIDEKGKLRIEGKKSKIALKLKVFTILTDKQKEAFNKYSSSSCRNSDSEKKGCKGKMGRKGMKGHGRSGECQ